MKKQGNAWEPAQESFNNNDDTIESDLKILYNNVDLYINYQTNAAPKNAYNLKTSLMIKGMYPPVQRKKILNKRCTLLYKGIFLQNSTKD